MPDKSYLSLARQFGKFVHQEVESTGGYLLVRQHALDFVKQLQKLGQIGNDVRGRTYHVSGESGCGKSATMLYAAGACREFGFLTIAIRPDEFTRLHRGAILPSSSVPGTFDQPGLTQMFLARLLDEQPEQLEKIKLKRGADVYSSYSSASPLVTLADLVRIGASESRSSPQVLRDMVAEIKLDTEIPVAVFVDNVNLWDHSTAFSEPRTYKKIMARRLSLVDTFQDFHYRAPANGVSVFSFTGLATNKYVETHVGHAIRCSEITVPRFTDSELHAAMCHYQVSKVITSHVNHFWVHKVKLMTGNIPRDVFRKAWTI